jgi:hypothetical protein
MITNLTQEPSCTFFKPSKITFLPSNRVLDRKPDRVTGYKVLIDYLHTRLCHVTFMIVIRSLWYRVFVKENNLDDDRLLRSFVTIKPAAEKILSDGTAKYRCARTLTMLTKQSD